MQYVNTELKQTETAQSNPRIMIAVYVGFLSGVSNDVEFVSIVVPFIFTSIEAFHLLIIVNLISVTEIPIKSVLLIISYSFL